MFWAQIVHYNSPSAGSLHKQELGLTLCFTSVLFSSSFTSSWSLLNIRLFRSKKLMPMYTKKVETSTNITSPLPELTNQLFCIYIIPCHYYWIQLSIGFLIILKKFVHTTKPKDLQIYMHYMLVSNFNLPADQILCITLNAFLPIIAFLDY